MKLYKSILFWAVCLCALFLLVRGILSLGGYTLRVWVRETATILIGVGLAAGVLQLCLLPKKTWLKVVLIILWLAAAGFFGVWGFILYAFLHPNEQHAVRDGKEYIVEEDVAFGSYSYRWYDAHGLFVRGGKLISEDDPYEWQVPQR